MADLRSSLMQKKGVKLPEFISPVGVGRHPLSSNTARFFRITSLYLQSITPTIANIDFIANGKPGQHMQRSAMQEAQFQEKILKAQGMRSAPNPAKEEDHFMSSSAASRKTAKRTAQEELDEAGSGIAIKRTHQSKTYANLSDNAKKIVDNTPSRKLFPVVAFDGKEKFQYSFRDNFRINVKPRGPNGWLPARAITMPATQDWKARALLLFRCVTYLCGELKYDFKGNVCTAGTSTINSNDEQLTLAGMERDCFVFDVRRLAL